MSVKVLNNLRGALGRKQWSTRTCASNQKFDPRSFMTGGSVYGGGIVGRRRWLREDSSTKMDLESPQVLISILLILFK